MSLTPDQLPDNIAELKRLLMARDAELTAAKNGLLVTQLTIEKLKAQIAKFRREKFGASSERIERVIAQLELALEEAEAEKAEVAASAPQPPEPETPATSSDAQSAETPAPEKKKRRQLPPGGRVQNLWRHRAAHGQRERHRGVGIHPRPVRGDPSRAPGVLVP